MTRNIGGQVEPVPAEAIPEGGFSTILRQTDIDVLECLNNTNPQAKEAFLADPALPKPDNHYGNLDAGRISRNLADIQAAEERLPSLTISEKERAIFGEILSFNFRKNQFVWTNHLYNTSTNPAERTLAADMHRQANLALYGPIDEGVFLGILRQKLAAIRRSALSVSERAAYQELTGLIGPAAEADCDFFTPRDETFAAFSQLIRSRFEGFFRHIPKEQETFTAYEVCDITNEILLEELGELGKGWKAVVGPNNAAAESDSRKKIITYPGKRSRGLYSPEDVQTIIVHELGVHAMRSMPFEKSSLSALATGLPGYEAFEEGLATAAEQAIRGKLTRPGLLLYVSIGLAAFMKKNFRETFEILVRLEALSGGASPSQCFDSVQRAFRGTGELPNNKDLVYLNGNNLAWKFIEAHIGEPDSLLRWLFETGKINPADPLHRSLFEAPAGEA